MHILLVQMYEYKLLTETPFANSYKQLFKWNMLSIRLWYYLCWRSSWSNLSYPPLCSRFDLGFMILSFFRIFHLFYPQPFAPLHANQQHII